MEISVQWNFLIFDSTVDELIKLKRNIFYTYLVDSHHFIEKVKGI